MCHVGASLANAGSMLSGCVPVATTRTCWASGKGVLSAQRPHRPIAATKNATKATTTAQPFGLQHVDLNIWTSFSSLCHGLGRVSLCLLLRFHLPFFPDLSAEGYCLCRDLTAAAPVAGCYRSPRAAWPLCPTESLLPCPPALRTRVSDQRGSDTNLPVSGDSVHHRQ